MRKLLCTLAALVAVTAAPAASAATIDFDSPGLIEIDNSNGQATLREDGFALRGEAAGFLTIDDLGTGGSGGLVLLGGNSISLGTLDGTLFNFSGLDAGRFDSGTSAMLSLTGIFGGNTQLSTMVTLGELASLSLTDWNGLSELRLSASADLVIDNIQVSPVPEPDTVAMLLLGLGALGALRSGPVRKVIGKYRA
jgi:hypothetical protein